MENYYIVRTDRAGVFFAQMSEQEAETCVEKKSAKLTNVRKIHYWDGAAAVEQISQDGVNQSSSRLTVVVRNMTVAVPIQVIPCEEKSIENLKGCKEWKK